MTRDPDRDRIRVRLFEHVVEHQFVVGVDLRFRGEGRYRPPGQFSLDGFHRQVRTLDDSNLDLRIRIQGPYLGPIDQISKRGGRVREVRLEHDAGTQVQIFRLAQYPLEHLRSDLEVPVLLHVEIDEFWRSREHRGVVEHPQSDGDALDLLVKGQPIDLCADGTDLHRHVLHIRTSQDLDECVESRLCFVISQD